MRICHVCSNYDKFFINLMEDQISKGLEPTVFYFRAKERGLPDVTSSYVDVRLNYRNWHRPFFYLKENYVLQDFMKIYNKKQFDIIHAHTLFSNGYIAKKIKERWGIPYIVAVRNVDINVFLKYRLHLRKLGIDILKEAEKIIFLSPTYMETTLSTYVPQKFRKEFSEKSIVIPNGIDPFFLDNKAVGATIDKNNIINIISVGHVCKNKNQYVVCKAIERLNIMGYKVQYTVVGSILDKKIHRKITEYPFVRYIPFLSKEELIGEYRKADLFVMPSLTETFGLTYVEAMSQGKPIIYTSGQGFDGQFEEGEVGFSVNSQSPDEIATKVEMILEDYEELSDRCIDRSNKFNWFRIGQEYIEIYEEILGRSNEFF